jgi:choline dehydrogenase
VPVAPFSRGTVGLSSIDTADNPIVDIAWIQDPRDVAVGVAALKRCREIANTTSFRTARIGNDEVLPGYEVSSDAELEEQVRRMAQSVYHAAGTNAMGVRGDPMAVVDFKARVFGVDRLRVVDASVFPVLVPGHPQATVYRLAEKIAADIKSAW